MAATNLHFSLCYIDAGIITIRGVDYGKRD